MDLSVYSSKKIQIFIEKWYISASISLKEIYNEKGHIDYSPHNDDLWRGRLSLVKRIKNRKIYL
jgi:hypothetical protein